MNLWTQGYYPKRGRLLSELLIGNLFCFYFVYCLMFESLLAEKVANVCADVCACGLQY